MDFFTLSFDRAVQFRDHVVAREPYRLRDLAVWMRDTGGPVEAMDASVGSLVPLWEWFVDFVAADCVGVPDEVVPSLWPFREQGTDAGRRRAFASESIDHYVRLVLALIDADAQWEVCVQPKRARDQNHHTTGIRLSSGDFVFLGFATTIAQKAADGDVREASGQRLLDLVAVRCPSGLLERAGTGEASALLRYAGLDLDEPSEIAAVTPLIAWAAEDAASPLPPPARRGGEDLLFAAGPGEGLEDLARLAPLPHERVAAVLAEAGFVTEDDQPIPVHDLLEEDFQLLHRDGLASLETATHNGRLRALSLEAVDGTPEQWELMLAPLRTLATEIGARLAPEDHVDDD